MPETVELPPDYYLTNFRALVTFVWQRYQPLLSAEEQALYRAFERLDRHSQQLYIRLLSRKGTLFRQGKLHYPEIENLPAAAVRLAEEGLLAIDPALALQDCLPLFTKAELVARCGVPEFKTARREQLVQALLEREAADAPASSQIASSQIVPSLLRGETLLQVLGGEAFDTFKLCFFGNLRQDLTEYVLRDLGIYRYEAYALDDSLPFNSRTQIEKHLGYYRCQEQLEASMAEGVEAMVALSSQLPDDPGTDASLTRRLERCRLTLARQLERCEAFSEAERLYRQCCQPPARERRARMAVSQGRVAEGLQLCRDILSAPVNEEERVFAESFGYRTAKKQGLAWAVPDSYQPQTLSVELPLVAGACVEQLAGEYLSAEGSCFYVENSLFNGVLGLLIWDIVFASVPGAFFNPFQVAPADFYTPDFYRLRRAALEARLQEVDSEGFVERIWRTYGDKQGIANPLVNWGVLPETLLHLCLARIPRDHWRSLLQRLLSDLRYNRNGLPDLIVFPDNGPDAGGYRLVEVKGPGDRLQKNQLRWMRFFAAESIPHQVLQVQWANGDVKAPG